MKLFNLFHRKKQKNNIDFSSIETDEEYIGNKPTEINPNPMENQSKNIVNIIINKNCKTKEWILNNFSVTNNLIISIALRYDLSSLKEIQICSADIESMNITIQNVSTKLHTKAIVTNDLGFQTGAMVIDGYNDNDEFQQIIIISENIIVPTIYNLLDFNSLPEEVKTSEHIKLFNFAIKTFIHELGHVVDNSIIYNNGHKKNRLYNYNYIDDYLNYIKENCITLWSEYYAEHFALSMMKSVETETSNSDFIQLLKSNSSISELNQKKKLDLVYRMLYFFMHTLAYYHTILEKDYDYNDLLDFSEYIDLFKKLEILIKDINFKYPKIDFNDFDKFTGLYNNFIDQLS